MHGRKWDFRSKVFCLEFITLFGLLIIKEASLPNKHKQVGYSLLKDGILYYHNKN